MQKELTTATDSGFMEAARQLAYRLHLPTTLVKFVIVGGIGFLINQFVLFLIYDAPLFTFLPDKDSEASLLLFTHPDIRLLIASVVAVEVAIVVQFNFHERWTFRDRNKGGFYAFRFLKYNASAIVSPIMVVGIVNTLTPALRDWFGDDSIVGHLAPYISNTVGTMVGFAWNWTLNSLIIWPSQRASEPSLEA